MNTSSDTLLPQKFNTERFIDGKHYQHGLTFCLKLAVFTFDKSSF